MRSINIKSDFNICINFLVAVNTMYTNHYCEESNFPNLHLDESAFLDLESFRGILQRYWGLILNKMKESGTTRELDPVFLFSDQPILRDLFARNNIGLDTFFYFRNFYKEWFSCCRVAYDFSIPEFIGNFHNKTSKNIGKNIYNYIITYREAPDYLVNKLEDVTVVSFDNLVMKGISKL